MTDGVFRGIWITPKEKKMAHSRDNRVGRNSDAGLSHMLHLGLLIVLMLAVAVVFLHGTANNANAEAGHITVLIGEATISRDGDLYETEVGTEVEVGDVIETSEMSRLKIMLADKSLMSLGPLTKFEVTRQDVAKKEESSFSSFKLWEGRIRAVVGSWWGGDSQFEVSTPSAVAGVRGTSFIVDVSGGTTTVVTTDGAVAVNGSSGSGCSSVAVGAGSFTVVGNGQCPSPPSALRREMHQWDRDLYLEPVIPLPNPKLPLVAPPVQQPSTLPPPRVGRAGGSGVYQGPGPASFGIPIIPPVGLPPKPATKVRIVVKGGPFAP